METFFNKIKGYLKAIPRNKLYLYILHSRRVNRRLRDRPIFPSKGRIPTSFCRIVNRRCVHDRRQAEGTEDPVQLGLNGTTISVQKERVSDVRLALASMNALPGGGGVGLELFDKTNYGMTEFMQNVNYKRAIQGELTRTINQMPEIAASRIHIAIPEKTLFTDKEKEATASVFLKLRQGKNLSKEQVLGIVNLVAGSVEGLEAGERCGDRLDGQDSPQERRFELRRDALRPAV